MGFLSRLTGNSKEEPVSNSQAMPPPPPRRSFSDEISPITRPALSSSSEVKSDAKPSLLSKATVTEAGAGTTAATNGFSFPPPDQAASASWKIAAEKVRKKVPVQPQCSQMAWMSLTKKTPDLAGLKGAPPGRLTLPDVKKHNTAEDCWIVLRGKVYNVTPYLDFHPGGKKILVKAGGTDATKLFDKFHKWVNEEFMMEKCLVGILDPSHK
mmetsp:Transcript_20720/g.39391  ORF Transcript_20720/g.39391 Transcript_20720/m.39391 type:complete len:211 (-) Transcript_20720:408-1040(-)|eukprot:CAMPEP_0114249744 /NCGR_PEP_ID=MMETSP0058-20121206/14316_1 /TAXON_ID=36894 /ORGANISM="Pyramimonas parkeae, CCMP726" /LENGTH=210 /DNA_ID=CAMNT_0001363331 /DNA_START=271 /DNA_END=906 /DNA_ORIENTATION=+